MSTGICIMYTEGVDAVVSFRDETKGRNEHAKEGGSVDDCLAAQQLESDGVFRRKKPL